MINCVPTEVTLFSWFRLVDGFVVRMWLNSGLFG